MPNHVINEVRFRNTVLADMQGVALNTAGEIDFEVLLPPPLHFWWGDVSVDHKEHFPGTALDWSRRTWGTKWNAYGFDQGYTSVRQDGTDVVLTFQTAWNTPRGWIAALFNTLDTDITVAWMDEGQARSHTERFACSEDDWRGPRWSIKEHQESTAEYRRMHALMWRPDETAG